jgi:hypothetical protein
VLDLALCNQVFDCPGYIFDRHVRIDTVLVEQVDAIGSKTPERRFGHSTDLFGSAVDARERAWPVLAVLDTKLRCDHDLVAYRR